MNAEPTITYGTLQQPLHTNAQYLLMQVGIGNGTYRASDVMDRLDALSLDEVRVLECRSDLMLQRRWLRALVGTTRAETITITDFSPDRSALEEFVLTTRKEAFERIFPREREQ